jgi:hypothetical protein
VNGNFGVNFVPLAFPYPTIRPAWQTTHRPPCQTPRMDLDRMTAEVEALLRLLAEWEREELALLMWERMEAEQEGQVQ